MPANKKLFLSASPNILQPLNGIFEKLFSMSDIIENQNVIVTESSIFDVPGDHRLPASTLLYREEKTAWASNNVENSYFQITFPFYQIELTNYTFMTTSEDDEIPRNWAVYCMDNNQKSVLAKEKDNQKSVLTEEKDNRVLCDGKSGEFNYCNEYDKEIFPVQTIKRCKILRFEQTGKNSCDRYYFVLSGIELFGSLYYISNSITQKQCFKLPILSPLFFIISIL